MFNNKPHLVYALSFLLSILAIVGYLTWAKNRDVYIQSQIVKKLELKRLEYIEASEKRKIQERKKEQEKKEAELKLAQEQKAYALRRQKINFVRCKITAAKNYNNAWAFYCKRNANITQTNIKNCKKEANLTYDYWESVVSLKSNYTDYLRDIARCDSSYGKPDASPSCSLPTNLVNRLDLNSQKEVEECMQMS